jgi:hypothetical protein
VSTSQRINNQYLEGKRKVGKEKEEKGIQGGGGGGGNLFKANAGGEGGGGKFIQGLTP